MTTPPPTPPGDPSAGQPPGVDRRTLQAARRKQRKRQKRRWPKRLVITLVVLVVLVGGLALGTYVYANYRYNQIKKVHVPHLEATPTTAAGAAAQPFNILLVGSDSRSFVKNATQKNAFGTPTIEGGQRSDVTIVARFIPATKQVWMLSIPRDLWVTIPDGDPTVSGMNRINAAFDGGPDLLIQTIQTDLHIPINHYVAVNFTGLQSMVTAIGGVSMDFSTPVKDAYSGLNVSQTGCQTVTGATALELVRARHLYYMTGGRWKYDGLSDFSRIQRQDAFFQAVLAKLNNVGFNPITINNFLGAAVKNLTIDDGLSESNLMTMATTFHGLPAANLHTETLPTTAFVTSGGADVLDEAKPYATAMIDAFNKLGTATTSATAPSTTTTTTTPTTVPAIPASTISVQVLNGVDFTKPIASETSATLRAAGFTVTGADNATSAGVTTTEIEYAEGHQAAAKVLAAHLAGATELVADPELQGNDLILIVGTSFTGVTGLTGATSGTTTTTTLPPPPGDVYTNTQQEPWNPTPC
ncbi:MAG TPA: LCP family protein [Acidimicrobiales bacterium]|nr:LCP family protein [Acidimicrobiales bacterium]